MKTLRRDIRVIFKFWWWDKKKSKNGKKKRAKKNWQRID
jgi:hypothetical protein